MTPYYSDDAVTIYCDDCLDVRAWTSADVLLVDPPYGIDYRSNKEGRLPRAIAGDQNGSLRDLVIWNWNVSGDAKPWIVFGSWRKPFALARARLVWDTKGALGMGALDLPWKPSSQDIYIGGKGFIGARDCGDVITVAPVQSMATNGRTHPHEKPIELLERLLLKCPVGVVADPCCGTGSTLLAAKALGRKAIGIEIEERYCEIAAKRCAQEVLALSVPPDPKREKP